MTFDDRDGLIWFDGKMVPWREARTHVLTHTLHCGLGVFEGVRAYHTADRGTCAAAGALERYQETFRGPSLPAGDVASAEERRLLGDYLARMRAAGMEMPNDEQAWTQYREGVAYGLIDKVISKREMAG